MGQSGNVSAATATSANMGGIAGIMASIAQLQAGRTNAALDKFNAKVAGLQAKDAIRRGEEEAAAARREMQSRKSSLRAGYAGQGVAVGQGSAAAMEAQADLVGAVDEATIRNNARLEAWGFKVQKADAKLRASATKTESIVGATGTLLTTGARFYARRYGED